MIVGLSALMSKKLPFAYPLVTKAKTGIQWEDMCRSVEGKCVQICVAAGVSVFLHVFYIPVYMLSCMYAHMYVQMLIYL